MDDSETLDIPQKWVDELQEVLSRMEQDIGRKFQFRITEFDQPGNVCKYIGKFDAREGRIEVYDMKVSYSTFDKKKWDARKNINKIYEDEEMTQFYSDISVPESVLTLNGVYENMDALKAKMKTIKEIELHISPNTNNVSFRNGERFAGMRGIQQIGKWRYLPPEKSDTCNVV